jgi:signal transduction histidine kinase
LGIGVDIHPFLTTQDMFLKIMLGLTILLHFFAASIAIRLTKVTKYNLSWMLISAALVFMAVRRFVEFLPFVTDFKPQDFRLFFVWMGIATSLFLAVGVFLIGKIFKYMREVELKTRGYEKKLLTSVIDAEERERKRFAKDLHDGLGPLLSSIKLSISSLNAQTSENQRQKVIASVDVAVNEAIRSIKEISDNLSPHVLTNFGITKALRNFVNKMQLAGKIKMVLDIQLPDERYSESIEIVIYRVACELITNTYKHSGARNARLELWKENGTLFLNYFDDGKGFNVKRLKEADGSPGMGCYNICSRVESLKGEVVFDEECAKGIFVSVKVPLTDG